MSPFSVLTLFALLSSAAALLQPACCASRLPASRVAASRAALCMCDAEAAPAEAAEPAAVAEEAPAEAEAAPRQRRTREPKTPLADLVQGAEVEGKIRSVMAYGAFVDIGAATDGLLHVSEISNEFIQDANEKLTAGETVTCKIKMVNMEKNQIALTCKEDAPKRERKPRADLTEFESADPKAFVTGKVNSITDYGAFVTLKEGVDGLCHISSIQEGGVKSVADVLSVGQEVQVRVVSFDKSKRRIGLSMKPWEEGENQPRGKRQRQERESFSMDSEADKMTEEELAELTVEDEGMSEASSFEAAFARAAFVQQMKEEKKRFSRQQL